LQAYRILHIVEFSRELYVLRNCEMSAWRRDATEVPLANKAFSEGGVSTQVCSVALIALASAASLFARTCMAQDRGGGAWATCSLHENLSGREELNQLGEAGPGPFFEQLLRWSSGEPGQPKLTLEWRDLGRAPVNGEISYRLDPGMAAAAPTASYKVVLNFNGGAALAGLPLAPSGGDRLSARFDTRRNGDLMESLARARGVRAVVYKGDQPIGQGAFEFAPERWRTSFAAFAQRVQANDPAVCHAASGPTVPVPPAARTRLR
jgi:hypothetical protein